MRDGEPKQVNGFSVSSAIVAAVNSTGKKGNVHKNQQVVTSKQLLLGSEKHDEEEKVLKEVCLHSRNIIASGMLLSSGQPWNQSKLFSSSSLTSIHKCSAS